MKDYETHQVGKYEVRVYGNGSKQWYLNGHLHREDGPAIEWFKWFNGDKYWFRNGQLHREDGPAVEDADGTKEWFLNGLCHREDGPAIIHPDGTEEWWLNDVELTKQQWREQLNKSHHCECGAEKCGTTHSTWCPKF